MLLLSSFVEIDWWSWRMTDLMMTSLMLFNTIYLGLGSEEMR